MLWQSSFRGFNVGALRLSNIVTPTNSPAIFYIVPEVTLQPGAQLYLLPDITKIHKEGHCTVNIRCDRLCFATWLHFAVPAYEEARQPFTNYVVRPLGRGSKMFAEKCSDIQCTLG